MSDLDVYVSIAANLEESGWSAVLSELDKETFAKLSKALDGLKDVADMTPNDEIPEDPVAGIHYLSERFDKVAKALRAHRKKLERLDGRLTSLEENGVVVNGGAGGGGGSQSASASASRSAPSGGSGGSSATTSNKGGSRNRRKRKLKTQAEAAADGDEPSGPRVEESRKHFYRFGSRNLQVIKPLDGYPDRSDARNERVRGNLRLDYVHGYNGQSEDSKQNIYVTPDGNHLIYFMAAVCIVMDLATGRQSFFTEHNDDVTTICLDPTQGSTLVASGQKDPKDEPGMGKDLPKIWIWDYTNCRKVQLLDAICWGKVARVQWSTSSHLYSVGGDPDQTLKIFDTRQFDGSAVQEVYKCVTMKEQILGFVLSPNPNRAKYLDEFVIFGKRKFGYAGVTAKDNRYTFKLKNVSITNMKKDGEKAFLCAQFLPDGRYVVGGASGAMYICKGPNPLQCVSTAHDRAVGDMAWDGNMLISCGMDQVLKKWMVPGLSGGSGGGSGGDKKKKKGGRGRGGGGGGGAGGDSALIERWTSGVVEIPGSDFQLSPRCMAFDGNSNSVFVGTKTNQMMRYEMKTEEASLVTDGHDGSIWGLATHPENAIFLTGGYDNAIKLWDANSRRCIETYEFEKEQGDKVGQKISCAAWSNNGDLFAVGTETSFVALFSYQPLKLLHMYQIPPKSAHAECEPVSYLRFSADSSLLGAAHMDSNLYIFSIVQGPDNTCLLEQWSPLNHVAAPTNIQFSSDNSYVKTITRDYEIVHWKLKAEKQKSKFSPRIPLPEDVSWADDPLIAGWDVEGLYQPGWDGTDLNDATVTSDGALVVSGDDYGKIRLHNYPCITDSPNRCYFGHCEFVVGVEFLRDDSQLISCGGDDMAIMQWVLTKDY